MTKVCKIGLRTIKLEDQLDGDWASNNPALCALMSALMCPEDDRISDLDGIKAQPVMSTVDWGAIAAHRTPAPMIPVIKSADDATNFNPEPVISGVDWGALEPFEGNDGWCGDF